MKLYLAGPMTGYPEHNYPAFFRAEMELRERGFEVANPATLGVREGWTWRDYMREGIRMLIDCDGLAYLPRSRLSRGATTEVDLALGIGIPIAPISDWINNKEKQ